jgi:hypothetical protein
LKIHPGYPFITPKGSKIIPCIENERGYFA